MKPTRAKVILAIVSFILGLGIFAFLVWLTTRAANDPTDATRVFTVGIAATLVSPLGFALLQVGWQLLRPPSMELVRQQAAAARELERSITGWQQAESDRMTAETTKAQIEAFITVRTRSLLLEKRIDGWRSDAERLRAELSEIRAEADKIGVDQAAIPASAMEVLNEIAEPTPSFWQQLSVELIDLVDVVVPWPIRSLVSIFRSARQ